MTDMCYTTLADGVRRTHQSAMPPGVPRYDVAIIGLGTAGAVAALTAARAGLRVLAIEKETGMGGTGIGGGIACYYQGMSGGIYESLDNSARSSGTDGFLRADFFHPDLKREALDLALDIPGVTLITEGLCTGLYLSGRHITGLTWTRCGAEHAAAASFVIDATAEAAVCHIAGCDFEQGRECDRATQPYSATAVRVSPEGVLSMTNFDAGYCDQNNPADLNQAIARGLSLHLKKQYDGTDHYLYLAPLPGFREGRRVKTEEILRFKDFIAGKMPKQPLCYAYSNHDSHVKDWAFESEAVQDWIVAASLWGKSFAIPVSLGMLIPRGFPNLLAPGRHLGVCHDMSQSLRMQRDMQKTGELAAHAVILAIKRGVRRLTDLPYAPLKRAALKTGCLRHPNALEPVLLKTPAAIRRGLKNSNAGMAIWSAFRTGDRIHQQLLHWYTQTGSSLFKNNCAIALALLGDEAAAPRLEKMALRRDPFLPTTSRRYNQRHGIAAVYLLGRLRSAGSVNTIASIMEKSRDNFQYMSHCLAALVRIGNDDLSTRHRITSILKQIVLRGKLPPLELKVSTSKEAPVIVDRDKSFRSLAKQAIRSWETTADEHPATIHRKP